MTTHDLSRRDVLKHVGAAVVAATGCGRVAPSAKPRVGLQLYTVRKAIEQNFQQTVGRIAQVGFAGIEYYPLPESIPPARAARVFKDAGLQVLGMHTPLPVGAQRDVAFRLADTFQCDRVIDPGWPQGDRYTSREATRKTADLFNTTASFLETKGLRLGLHNHWWELERTDGVVPFYELLKWLDESVFFEIDTYWVKTAGMDPAEVVRDFVGRAPLLHIKDGPAVKGSTMYDHVPAGEGSLDFRALAMAGGDTVGWMVVEFDEYGGDIFDGIRRSYTFLTEHKLAEGKV